MSKTKQDQDKDIKTFCGIPEIMIGGTDTQDINGVHLLRPTQEKLSQAKEIALDNNLNKIFIYHCTGIFTGTRGKGYTDEQTVQNLNSNLQ